ncbi:hypothetical protein V1512DRAFT_268304 [Lipomyces arxii]|uniref:uncharacterized protein n=1 Tax=Lipomyces arxii TaxID=56418 RepID=UPI0034CF0A1A
MAVDQENVTFLMPAQEVGHGESERMSDSDSEDISVIMIPEEEDDSFSIVSPNISGLDDFSCEEEDERDSDDYSDMYRGPNFSRPEPSGSESADFAESRDGGSYLSQCDDERNDNFDVDNTPTAASIDTANNGVLGSNKSVIEDTDVIPMNSSTSYNTNECNADVYSAVFMTVHSALLSCANYFNDMWNSIYYKYSHSSWKAKERARVFLEEFFITILLPGVRYIRAMWNGVSFSIFRSSLVSEKQARKIYKLTIIFDERMLLLSAVGVLVLGVLLKVVTFSPVPFNSNDLQFHVINSNSFLVTYSAPATNQFYSVFGPVSEYKPEVVGVTRIPSGAKLDATCTTVIENKKTLVVLHPEHAWGDANVTLRIRSAGFDVQFLWYPIHISDNADTQPNQLLAAWKCFSDWSVKASKETSDYYREYVMPGSAAVADSVAKNVRYFETCQQSIASRFKAYFSSKTGMKFVSDSLLNNSVYWWNWTQRNAQQGQNDFSVFSKHAYDMTRKFMKGFRDEFNSYSDAYRKEKANAGKTANGLAVKFANKKNQKEKTKKCQAWF